MHRWAKKVNGFSLSSAKQGNNKFGSVRLSVNALQGERSDHYQSKVFVSVSVLRRPMWIIHGSGQSAFNLFPVGPEGIWNSWS